MDTPIIFLKSPKLNSIILFFFDFVPVIVNLLAWPPHISRIKAVATSKPSSIELGSIPLSNLYLASVFMFSALALFLILEGKK